MKDEIQQRLNSTVIARVLSIDVVEGECEIFRLEDSLGTHYKQAVAIIDEDISVVFSLPQGERKNIYILASDGETDILRNILANIEESESSKTIKLGNVLLLDSSELKKKDIVGILFLPVDTSPVFEELEATFEFECEKYNFMLVAFLSSSEHAVWKSYGHDALMDYFLETNKDLIAF